MIVVDASVAVRALEHDDEARLLLSSEELHAPHHIDLEVANALRRHERLRLLRPPQVAAALAAWQMLQLRRHPVNFLLTRIWELRHNLSPYDAAYVALAQALGCTVVTIDSALIHTPPAQRVGRVLKL